LGVYEHGIEPGKCFNSYDFGGYLIFEGIPTFIDGRAPPFTDSFLREYSNAVGLADIKAAFQLLAHYKVAWILLLPEQPLSKALADSGQWKEAYADKFSVIFVRS
jgi:hypothetical protein